VFVVSLFLRAGFLMLADCCLFIVRSEIPQPYFR
jgi:hypothetical protein